MKKTKLIMAVISAFLVIGLTGCPKFTGEENTNNTDNNTSEIVDEEVKGPLTTATTWEGKDDAGNSKTYYINSTLYVKNGGSLTIEE